MNNELTLDNLIAADGPTCLVIKARLEPTGDQNLFQPAGFPEVGHVIYKAPRRHGQTDDVCIVDSAASMANHLESVCLLSGTDLHADLEGLPYVVCVTDREFDREDSGIRLKQEADRDKVVFTSLAEGHRIASDYFVAAYFGPVQWKRETHPKNKKGKEQDYWQGMVFRDQLKKEFGGVELKESEESSESDNKKGKKKGKKKPVYFLSPEDQWQVYKTIFKYDPNSLVHGVLFAQEQIKISRFLTASLEAFGAKRWARTGVKFDRLGKTLSGQPIFPVDEETAHEIRATFILDLALLRSYGRNGKGLNDGQKKLLLGLALWKIRGLLAKPFRYRSKCYLKCFGIEVATEGNTIGTPVEQEQMKNDAGEKPAELNQQSDQQSNDLLPSLLLDLNIGQLITDCNFGEKPITEVYYPADKLFKLGKDKGDNQSSDDDLDEQGNEVDEEEAEDQDGLDN